MKVYETSYLWADAAPAAEQTRIWGGGGGIQTAAERGHGPFDHRDAARVPRLTPGDDDQLVNESVRGLVDLVGTSVII